MIIDDVGDIIIWDGYGGVIVKWRIVDKWIVDDSGVIVWDCYVMEDVFVCDWEFFNYCVWIFIIIVCNDVVEIIVWIFIDDCYIWFVWIV